MECFGCAKKSKKKTVPMPPSPRAEAKDKGRLDPPAEPPRRSLLQTIAINTGSSDPPPDYSEEQLAEHMTAYRNARYYHATRPKRVPKILDAGLDPSKRGTKKGAEATSNPAGVEAAKKDPAVFLGGDMTTTRYYNKQLKQPDETPHLRAFLTPAQVEETPEDLADQDNVAFRTHHLIPPKAIIHGRHADQSDETLRSIFGIVQQHYPDGGRNVSVDDVMKRHAVAIQRGLTTHQRDQHGRMQLAKPLYHGRRQYQRGDEGYVSD